MSPSRGARGPDIEVGGTSMPAGMLCPSTEEYILNHATDVKEYFLPNE